MGDGSKEKKLDKIFAAARGAEFYDPGIEYAFETRVMSKIRKRREGKTPILIWAWRLIPVFLSALVLLGIWTLVSEPAYLDLRDAARIGNGEAMLMASLTGE